MQRGERTRTETGEHDQTEHEQHDPVIQFEGDPERRGLNRHRLHEPAHAGNADQDAEAGAGSGKDEDLGEVLADDAGAGRTERHPDRHLALPERCAGHQQVRHVDAGDQEHADPGAQHGVEQVVNLRAYSPSTYGTTSPPMPRLVSGNSDSSWAAIAAACAFACCNVTSGLRRATTG